MCHESFNQMEAIFKGKQRTLESTALELLARTQDLVLEMAAFETKYYKFYLKSNIQLKFK